MRADSAETLGKRLRVSCSRLYATALAEFLAKHRGRKVTERLNTIYVAISRIHRTLAECVRSELARSSGGGISGARHVE